MAAPFLASITVLPGGGGGAQPKGGGGTHLAMIIPIGGGGHADQGLPDAGGETDPGYGHEGGGGHPWFGGGRPNRPGHDLPIDPSRPDAGLPGGTPVPPDTIATLPMPGGDLTSQVVVLVYRPDHGWVGKSYTPAQPK